MIGIASMNMRNSLYKSILMSIIYSFLLFAGQLSAMESWDAYASFLSKYTSLKNNQVYVDYDKIQKDNALKPVLIELNNNYERAELTEKHKLTFYINAYNILTINLVTNNYPIDSIKDVGSFFSPVWNKEAGIISGKPFSLDEIEHEILRPMGEPRIHFAIVCASISCPDLRREPFQVSKLHAQLDEQTINFLTSKSKGVSVQGETIYVSKIFKWFSEDFGSSGGVLKYISKFMHIDTRDLELDYLDYDWNLNSK